MKRTLFFVLLALQVAIISLVAIQDSLIDRYGETVKILQDKSEFDNDYYQQDELYLDYEINYLSGTSWDAPNNMKNNEKVYVLLEADKRGIYHAVEATGGKMKAKQNQVVLVGKYQSYASSFDRHRIDYGIEHIRENEKYSKLDQRKQWITTLKIAPWGQKKVINIEEK